ncbi:uncharacterized protein L969DRAFT_18202 [Mixia osmundae IAM 14324]|uniref:Uncharacterized protein n=1 Tax=Mixia osmundae (strain CBS 9802 / IAM 14324 / JCM 22182 / KY 12970) TaxID=764103 RepID=G7E6M7_MIXOS|nr:uncharacterized protein L969DRAFT_18202 [Mixia osmundae IAM 14324]KEI39135.1 hypothetical protein L969DRAFT_18202 [Mixia osmundae IAM 14324]GAA98487.1 hypothetical protein E5Q_05173 [Mixia osmundae IAM 14324]
MAASRLLRCTCASLRSLGTSARVKQPRTLPATRFSSVQPPEIPSTIVESFRQEQDSIPWFVDPSYEPGKATPSQRTPEHTRRAQPRPDKLPERLWQLHAHLTESPLFEASATTFIDAKASTSADTLEDMTGGSVWDWVVVLEMASGRERGLRSATGQVAEWARDVPAVQGKRKRVVAIEGLEPPEPTWTLVDGGEFVVHLFTTEARRTMAIRGDQSGNQTQQY